jgi:hypothetical protein
MLGNESPTQFPIPLVHRANPTTKIAIDADTLEPIAVNPMMKRGKSD